MSFGLRAISYALRAEQAQERAKGIEPSSSAWKAVALPLSYARNTVLKTLSSEFSLPKCQTVRWQHLIPFASGSVNLFAVDVSNSAKL